VKLLLDTHLLLWAASSPERLSDAALELLENQQNQVVFSAASLWEITIKRQLGRADFDADPRLLRRGLLDNGWHELAISSEHAVAVERLPALHRDPFDRILLAQADIEGMLLLTSDDTVNQYPGSIRKV
jgi:PIN domain nuclease of toxin-antitoxin system